MQTRRDFLKTAGRTACLAGLASILELSGCASLPEQQRKEAKPVYKNESERARNEHKERYTNYQRFMEQDLQLTPTEKRFLGVAHRQYGQNIKADDYLKGAKDPWVKDFKYLSGSETLDDKQLIYLLRNIPDEIR